MLQERICQGGCGMKFKVMPTSPQFYARSNCLTHCKDRSDFTMAAAESLKIEIAAAIPAPVVPIKIEEPVVALEEQKPKAKAKPQAEQPKSKKRSAVKKEVESDLVSKTDHRLQQFLASCIADAKKLLGKQDQLRTKMDLAYLCLTDASLRGKQNCTQSINDFALAVGLAAEELRTWIEVRRVIWNRLEDPSALESYLFEDLYAAMSFVSDDVAEKDILKVLEDRISSKYLTLIAHYRKSIKDIEHFYAKYSLDLLPKNEFDALHESVQFLHGRFKNHAERKRRK
jgi:hypothetical protein